MNQEEYKNIADLLYKDMSSTNDRAYFESFYKKRAISNGEEYMRVAPSPTGELHAGALYTAIINDIISHRSGGKMIARIEDTDSAREVEGARERIINYFEYFDIKIDESYKAGGDYGPYVQSERRDIYKAFICDFLVKGYAYPCFMTTEEVDAAREEQTAMKMRPGVYGRFAKHRNLSYEQIKEKIDRGEKYVIRLKSNGNFENKIKFTDEIMGDLELSINDEDFILAKGDGIPTYHLAHLVDDYLMGITFVIRANEWVSSITKHLELWDKLGVSRPKYGHIMPINKKDGSSVRKLSKRKDPEASVSYYISEGYTVEALKSYLIRLANPSFDEWWDMKVKENDVDREVRINYKDYDFIFDELKRNSRGPLLDFAKLNNISADYVASLHADHVHDMLLLWAKDYDGELYALMSVDKDYALKILSVERETAMKRKDISKWSDVKDNIFYFYDELFAKDKMSVGVECDNLILEKIKIILSNDINYNEVTKLEDWMTYMKDEYAKLKEEINNIKFGEFMMIIRKLITKREKTPNLFYVMRVMGKERVVGRVKLNS